MSPADAVAIARALRDQSRAELLGKTRGVILGLLDEVERLQALVRPLPVIAPPIGVGCAACGARADQNCTPGCPA